MLAEFELEQHLFQFIIVVAVLFLSWAASAGLALIALCLTFSARRRDASKLCAVASIFASVPISLFDALLFLKLVEPGGSTEHWSFAAVTLAPMNLAIAIFCFDQYSLRNNKAVTHAD